MDLDRYLATLDYAIRCHHGQQRKDGARLYIVHPVQVAEILRSHGHDDTELLMAALLHDTIEDCTVRYDQLAERFGETVADLVVEVTSDGRLPRRQRREVMEAHAGELSDRAKALKLADRIANVGDLGKRPPEGWATSRIREYLAHSRRLLAAIQGTHPSLEATLEALIETVESGLE